MQDMCRVIAKQVQTLKSFNMNSIKETRHYLFPAYNKDKIKNIENNSSIFGSHGEIKLTSQ